MTGKTLVDRENRCVITEQAEDFGLWNLRVQVENPNFLPEAERFVQHVMKYQIEFGTKVQPNQTLSHGFWAVKFIESDGCLEAWELNGEMTDFVRGVDRTLAIWMVQKRLCEERGAAFDPPLFNRLAAITEGVLEGDLPIEGVRYPESAGSEMSGWCFFTDRYNGDIQTVKTIHLHHLLESRPNLTALLALPFGYRFIVTKDGYNAWFDPAVVSE